MVDSQTDLWPLIDLEVIQGYQLNRWRNFNSFIIPKVFVAEMEGEVFNCTSRNIHNFTQKDIEKIHRTWEPTPDHYNKLDLRSFLQDQDIEEVQMEDAQDDQEPQPGGSSGNNYKSGGGGREVRIPGLRRQLDMIRNNRIIDDDDGLKAWRRRRTRLWF